MRRCRLLRWALPASLLAALLPYAAAALQAKPPDAPVVSAGPEAAWPGPDGYGYTGQTVAYDWVEISGSGTPISGLGDDSYAGPYSIGFAFPFYGNSWTAFYVSSNGFISFGAGSGDLSNDCLLPNANGPDNLIALMWDDLDPGDTGDVVYYQSFSSCPAGSGQCLVVQYEHFCHYPGGPSCALAGTFQAVLYQSGQIRIQFEDSGVETGAGSTTGIEGANAAGDHGLTYACDSGGSLTDGRAILLGFETGVCWEASPASPVATMDNAAIAYGGKLYVLNGYGSGGAVQIWNGVQWTAGAAAPAMGYVVDGCLGRNASGNPVIDLFGDTVSFFNVQRYDINSNSWSTFSFPAGFPSGGLWAPDILSMLPHTGSNVCYISGGATTPGGGNTRRLYAYYPNTRMVANLGEFTYPSPGVDFHFSWYVPSVGASGAVCIGGGADNTARGRGSAGRTGGTTTGVAEPTPAAAEPPHKAAPAGPQPAQAPPEGALDVAGEGEPAPESPQEAGEAAPAAGRAGWAVPDNVLFDNGPMTTHPGGGYNGANASALQSALGMNTYGFGQQHSLNYWMADDFEVSSPSGWDLDSITLFAYQTGTYGYPPVSTMTGVYYQILDGQPGGGGNVICGDKVTNRMTGTGWSGIYRTLDTNMLNTQRPIMADTVSIAAGCGHLAPGTYWIMFASTGSGGSGPWANPVTILGQLTTGSALQSLDGGLTWNAALDSGTSTQQGMPFLIEGTIPGGAGVYDDTQCYDISGNHFHAPNADLGRLPQPWWGGADGYRWQDGQYQAWLYNGVDQNGALLQRSAFWSVSAGGFEYGPDPLYGVYRLEGDGLGDGVWAANGSLGGFNYSTLQERLVPCGGGAREGWAYLPAVRRNALYDPTEPNDTFGQAWGPLVLGRTYNGFFPNTSDNNDYYYFDLADTRSIEVSLTQIPSGTNFDLELYNAAHTLIGWSYNGGNASEKITKAGLGAGRYYVRALRTSGTSLNPYSLRVADLTDPYEPNDTFETAWGPLASGQTYSGYFLSDPDLEDYYYFDQPAKHGIDIWLRQIPSGNDYNLYLYDAGRVQIGYSGNPGNADEHIVLPEQSAGRYYVRVRRLPGGPIGAQPYTLSATYQ